MYNLHLYPNLLILDTSDEIKRLKKQLTFLPMSDEIDLCEICIDLTECVSSRDDVYNHFTNCVITITDRFANRYPDDTVGKFYDIMQTFVTDIHTKLISLLVYDSNGTMWYSFHSFCGNDMVLYRLDY